MYQESLRALVVSLIVIGFFNSSESKYLSKSLSGARSERCKSTMTGYALTDVCGSYCSCDSDGILTDCEVKECPPGEEPYSPIDDYEVLMEEYAGDYFETCEPGKIFYDGCNWCSCSVDGKPSYCTLKLCWRAVYRNKDPKDAVYQVGVESEKCKASSTKYILKDSCGSYCKCNSRGVILGCQREKCPPGEEPYSPIDKYEVDVKEYGGENIESCEPNKGFTDGCNWCGCGPDGKPSFCTQMLCWRPVYSRKQ